jgi:hypothetical protein
MMPNMSQIRTRTRGSKATLKIECSNEAHEVCINLNGEIESKHDNDADQVLMALGGEIHSCGRGVNSFQAAKTLSKIMAGETDLATLRYNNVKGWYDSKTCANCPNSSFRLSHYYSLDHLAATFSADKTTIRTLYKWIIRKDASISEKISNNKTIKTMLKTLDDEAIFPSINGLYLSRTYIDSAKKFTGNDPSKIVEMRLNGITVEWIKKLAELVNDSSAEYAQKNNHKLYTSLSKTRNVDPTLVAKYINSGIVTHFYTYSKVDAHPKDILTIYRNTKGSKTLAELLNNGYTIPQALREYGNH